MYRVKIITLFPNSFPGLLNTGVVGKALKKKIWSLKTIDPRKYSKGNYKKVDDTTAGGGPGMILKADVIGKSINACYKNIKSKDSYPMTDYILIDAPCTGTGVLGRKPDIKWRRKNRDVLKMAKKQFDILSHCSKFVKANGVIVYATCSIEPEENWNVVDRFLNLNPNFRLDDIHSMVPKSWIDKRGAMSTLPYIDIVDGMFAARIIKE